MHELATRQIVVKLGEAGALTLDGDRITSAPAANVKVVDTTGADDAFLSAYSLALANAWAGLAVQIHGTTPPARADLLAMLDDSGR